MESPRAYSPGENCIGSTNKADQMQIDLKRVRPRSPNGQRHRSASAARDAYKRTCWSIKSNTNKTNRDELVEMIIEMIIAHGGAKSWPVGSDIFDGESHIVMDHIRAKGWLKQHIPVWCEAAINDIGSRELKKCPPSGFYPSSRATRAENSQDALLIRSACFGGARHINLPHFQGNNNRFETTIILLHCDQIRGDHKCTAVEAERFSSSCTWQQISARNRLPD